MDIRQLRYFVAAAEAGTISRAAARCGVAQPSLSQQLMKLEADLGVDLFDRLGRGVALTEAGRLLLPKARAILGMVEDAETNLGTDVERGRGRLSIGAIPTMAPYLVPHLVAALRAEFPECDIAVSEDLTQNLVEAVEDGQLDLAITSTPIEGKHVELEVVGSEPLVVVAAAAHPLAGSGGVGLEELRGLPAVTLHEMHCLGRQIGDFCTRRRLASNVACRSTQMDTLLRFVALGLGVSIVPAMVAGADSDGSRAYVQFREDQPRREIAVVRRSGRRRSRLGQRFTELLRERIAGAESVDH